MLYEEYLLNRKQYQEIGRDLLLEKKHACLFFEPGKGKTYPAIEAVREVNTLKDGKANVLIISGADAIRRMWEPEIVPQKILPKNTFLVTDRTAIGDLSQELLRRKWDIVLIDECHIVKSNSTKIHKLVYKLCRFAEYAWGLTGTPRGNTDIDIWCQLQALHVGGQGKMSYTAWTNIFCDFEVGYSSYGQFKKPVGIKETYRPIWNQLLDDYCMFVDYDEDDCMPLLNIETVYIPYEKTSIYDDAMKGIIAIGEHSTTMAKMVAIMKAHQACNGYLYLPDKTIHRFAFNQKLNELDKYITDKCVVVYKFEADYQDLSRKFGSRATNDVLEFKRGGYEILLLQCGLGKSFNLQDHSHTIIFYTYDYSFIKYKQMIHRCWRMGQLIDTKVIVFQHKNTVEKQIWSAVIGKQKMHDLYMSITKSL